MNDISHPWLFKNVNISWVNSEYFYSWKRFEIKNIIETKNETWLGLKALDSKTTKNKKIGGKDCEMTIKMKSPLPKGKIWVRLTEIKSIAEEN